MNENIFADAPREDHETLEEALSSVDKELQEKNPAESQAEKEPDLSKNETWKRMREELELEKKARLELETRFQDLEKSKPESVVKQPEFLTKMIGENEEIAKDWSKERESLKEEVKQEFIQDQINSQKKAEAEKEYWKQWTQDRLAEVEKEFKVDFKSDESKKNELSKIMLEYSPTDEHGNLDYRKGMKILNSLKLAEKEEETQKTKIKKNIADATISKETSVKSDKDYVTRKDLRGGWRSLVSRE